MTWWAWLLVALVGDFLFAVAVGKFIQAGNKGYEEWRHRWH